MLTIPGLRSPADPINGLLYFGRMIDKIRLHHAGKLPAEYVTNLGKGFDERCLHLLCLAYPVLVDRVTTVQDTDEQLLAWAFAAGRQPDGKEIEVWNEFMRKRGWKDALTPTLLQRKAEHGFAGRADIETFFQFIDADEGRF